MNCLCCNKPLRIHEPVSYTHLHMNCLCCNKPLRIHEPSGWHRACIKRFFGTLEIPEVSIDEETLDQLALESSNKGYTAVSYTHLDVYKRQEYKRSSPSWCHNFIHRKRRRNRS